MERTVPEVSEHAPGDHWEVENSSTVFVVVVVLHCDLEAKIIYYFI
jgi:hypothetical protein